MPSHQYYKQGECKKDRTIYVSLVIVLDVLWPVENEFLKLKLNIDN